MTTDQTKELLRQLPAIEKLLNTQELRDLQGLYARPLVIETLRAVVSDIRNEILSGKHTQLPAQTEYSERTRQTIAARTRSRIRPVVNATGTVTHTNLGRSLLSDAACKAIQQAAENYVNLEYDIQTGKRGHRDRITEPLLQQLTGCEAATVVNNNAAAVLLALQTLASGKEVIVSRGELIEIGGAFRIPDVMAASGAILREVGTTNRTHLRDYEAAINENTGLLLKVHPSNYKILGFTSTATIEALTELGKQRGIPTMEDLGSGALIDMTAYGLPHEPLVGERIASGVDVVTFSGDKLLGGPQAGIIVGKAAWIEKMRKNPMMRALRVDKLTIAGLSATLQRYFAGGSDITAQFPMLNRYTRPIAELYDLAENLKMQLRDRFCEKVGIQISETYGQIGSGALPVETLPSVALVLEPTEISVETLAALFRKGPIPIIGRIKEGLFWLDLRTVYEKEQAWILETAMHVAEAL